MDKCKVCAGENMAELSEEELNNMCELHKSLVKPHIKTIKTGQFKQYQCDCGNIYDDFESALFCEHDFYDGITGKRDD